VPTPAAPVTPVVAAPVPLVIVPVVPAVAPVVPVGTPVVAPVDPVTLPVPATVPVVPAVPATVPAAPVVAAPDGMVLVLVSGTVAGARGTALDSMNDDPAGPAVMHPFIVTLCCWPVPEAGLVVVCAQSTVALTAIRAALNSDRIVTLLLGQD
jgi:hypothetical protein